MKNGWFRLWVVLTCILLFGSVVSSTYSILGKEACYTFVSVSIADSVQQEYRQQAEAISKEVTEKTFCGTTQYSALITIEELAKRGVITQVGVSWLEPDGWSLDHYMLDVIESKNIKATEIISRMYSYVRGARMHNSIRFVAAAIAASFATLLLGFAISWVRQGFQSGRA